MDNHYFKTSITFGQNEPSNRCLGIVVPYRDRKSHLDEFTHYLPRWFSTHRNKAPKSIVVKIIEQEEGLAFNRGKIKNIGFQLIREVADYVCFHDIDYLPTRADYTEPRAGWAHLVSKGPENYIDPRGVMITIPMTNFSGGVVLFTKNAFEKINGYSNSYWGWGFEDKDLLMRCRLCDIPFDRRSGRFKLLPHLNAGFEIEGNNIRPNQEHLRNKELFDSRFPPENFFSKEASRKSSAINADGLSSLRFSILSRTKLPCKTDGFDAEKITVSI